MTNAAGRSASGRDSRVSVLAAGPIVGGLLLNQFWWGSVLLVNVPIVAIAIVLVVLFVPTSKDEHAPPLDIIGAVLASVGMTALIYGIIEAPSQGLGIDGSRGRSRARVRRSDRVRAARAQHPPPDAPDRVLRRPPLQRRVGALSP